MIKVILNNSKKYPIINKEILKIVDLSEAKCKKIKGEVEINLVDNRVIKKLNKEWRDKDKATDVLSFAWKEDKKMKSDFLGQIFISYPKIKTQAKEYGVSVKQEFLRMLVHGLLHLVGFDHIKEKDSQKMYSLQEGILKKFYENK